MLSVLISVNVKVDCEFATKKFILISIKCEKVSKSNKDALRLLAITGNVTFASVGTGSFLSKRVAEIFACILNVILRKKRKVYIDHIISVGTIV